MSQKSRSQKSHVIFSIAATALTLGVVPLALGRDLYTGSAATAQPGQVNRAAKADRAAGVVRSTVPMRTIALPLHGFSDTSVLIRIPVAQAAPTSAPARSLLKPPAGAKPMVACEPVVSTLTEVARKLGPGRCVT